MSSVWINSFFPPTFTNTFSNNLTNSPNPISSFLASPRLASSYHLTILSRPPSLTDYNTAPRPIDSIRLRPLQLLPPHLQPSRPPSCLAPLLLPRRRHPHAHRRTLELSAPAPQRPPSLHRLLPTPQTPNREPPKRCIRSLLRSLRDLYDLCSLRESIFNATTLRPTTSASTLSRRNGDETSPR